MHVEKAVEVAAFQNFDMQYCCHGMDESTIDISSILADPEVKSWHGVGKTHIYFWFMFKVTRARA